MLTLRSKSLKSCNKAIPVDRVRCLWLNRWGFAFSFTLLENNPARTSPFLTSISTHPSPSRVPSSMSLLRKTCINPFSFVVRCRLRRSRDSRLPVITTTSLRCRTRHGLEKPPRAVCIPAVIAWHVFPLQRPADGETEKQIFSEGYLASLTPGLTPIIFEIGSSSLSFELMKNFSTLFSKSIWGSSFFLISSLQIRPIRFCLDAS